MFAASRTIRAVTPNNRVSKLNRNTLGGLESIGRSSIHTLVTSTHIMTMRLGLGNVMKSPVRSWRGVRASYKCPCLPPLRAPVVVRYLALSRQPVPEASVGLDPHRLATVA